MKVVAVTNHRGGVGKSTTTMMIAEGLALQHDYRVLVLDFDPQAMITVNLIGVAALDKLSHSQTTVVELLLGRLQGMKTPIYSFILTGVSDIQELHSGASHGRVDLAPMHPRLLAHMSSFEAAFANSPNRRPADDLISETWKQELSRLEEFYDLVLIDCPAGATALALSALRLSDVLILPTLLERNSLSLLDHYLKVIVNDKLEINTKLRGNILLLPTLFVRSNPVQHMLLDQLTRTGKEMFIPCPVPHSTAIQRAVLHSGAGAVRLVREKYSSAYADFEALADWIAKFLRKLEKKGASRPSEPGAATRESRQVANGRAG